jgi:HD superfamily phosphodiesterase
LKLSGMMKTNTGKRMAMQRHAFMENFLEQFFIEVSGRG